MPPLRIKIRKSSYGEPVSEAISTFCFVTLLGQVFAQKRHFLIRSRVMVSAEKVICDFMQRQVRSRK